MRISDWSSDVCSSDLRVLAQDIVAAIRDRLASRVERERLDNVSVKLGEPLDPKLPGNSFDRIFLVNMYHEIQQPYAFLWHLHTSLKPGGQIVVVDKEATTDQHGRSEEHTSELQSLMRISYAVFCLKKKTNVLTQYSINSYHTSIHVNEVHTRTVV